MSKITNPEALARIAAHRAAQGILPGRTYTMTCNTAGLLKGATVTVQSVTGPIVELTNGHVVLRGDLA